MAVVSMKQLLESGVHFGHPTRRWNPKMAPYIFTQRHGIHIIDLKKTASEIEVTYKALFDVVANGGKVLFVGTKKQAQEAIKDEAIRTGHYYVNQRWLGGTLTNFQTIKKRIKRLHDLYKQEEDGVFEKLPKKEVLDLLHERERLEKFLGGIKEMKKVPEAIFVVDPVQEINAILEARKLHIPVFGIIDTNCDPEMLDYVIPGNDDAIRAVKLLTWVMGNAIIEAQGGVVEKYDDEEAAEVPKHQPRKPAREGFAKPSPRVADEVRNQKAKETPVEKVAPAVEEVKVEKVAPVVEVEEDGVDLNSLTVAELRELAKEEGLKNISGLKKAELIEALKK